MARLNSRVHVVHPRKGVVWLKPGDKVPQWATGQIRRPELLDDHEPDLEPSEPATGNDDPPAATEPPRAGPGATAAAWRAFLTHPDIDLQVAEDATRAELIDAWDAYNADPEADAPPDPTEPTMPATGDQGGSEGAQEPGTGTEAGSEDRTAPTGDVEGEGANEPDATGGQTETPAEPPRSGRGSGEDAWREFADAKEVEVPDDASRDDIIELLEAEGVIAPADADA